MQPPIYGTLDHRLRTSVSSSKTTRAQDSLDAFSSTLEQLFSCLGCDSRRSRSSVYLVEGSNAETTAEVDEMFVPYISYLR